MYKGRRCQADDEMNMKNIFSRRDFVCSGALVAAGFAASKQVFAAGAGRQPADEGSPIRLGGASYTFRKFSPAQVIGFLEQLHVLALKAKDVKEHLPKRPPGEAAALPAYGAARGQRRPSRSLYF